ncbi:acetoacetate decarboxylase family protein [Variovorax rhizosphaerae]|uniref:Acetoacetate decarboxylase family protein n=1 Tax=Variovorax rhizosphaerae TaxID=1836200 RepID=A0ABU8WYB9_9BURK
MANLPPFISWIGHGAASLAQPAVFTGAKSFAFGFRTDRAATQKLVDDLLNPVGGGRVHYLSLGWYSMISFMTIDRCTSQVDAIGWEPGRECALWIPLLETNHARGMLRIVLWTPYIFINYTIGMLTGRDVWGWPKVWARIDVPADSPQAPGAFTCSTTVFETLNANTQAQISPLLTVTSRSALPAAGEGVQWTDGRDAARTIGQSLLGGFVSEHIESLIAGPTIPTVQMKQLRDSLDPSLACFQAIVDSPAQMTGFHGGGVLTASDFTLEVLTCESHQIVRDLLGTTPTPGRTTLPIEFAAWLAFDFKALQGAVVVSAT